MEHTILADFDRHTGPVKPLNAVNNGPVGGGVRGVGNFADYAALHIPYARLHDASFFSGYGGEFTVDVHRVFPDFGADETDPASYNFTSTDAYLQNILAAGTQPFYRLGASIEHGQKKGTFPPADYEKWARICEKILLHYNEGWADGFHMGIRYAEIWNEPDCRNADGSNPCWQGTEEAFIDFFDVAARYLKGAFPELRIGGPAFCSVWAPLMEKALKAWGKLGTPLDFVSYHWYGARIADLRETMRRARELCVQAGYGSVELILNEWNYIRGWLGEDWAYSLRTEKGQKGASFIAAAMCAGQPEPLDMLMYYDARPSRMNGLFDTDTYRPLPGYETFRAFAVLAGLEQAVPVTAEEDAGLYALAAGEGGRGAMLFTRYTDEDTAEDLPVKVCLRGLREGTRKQVRVSVAAAGQPLTPTREEIFTAQECAVYLTVPLHAVCLLEILPERE